MFISLLNLICLVGYSLKREKHIMSHRKQKRLHETDNGKTAIFIFKKRKCLYFANQKVLHQY